jgi:hypothetical protein
MVESGKMHSNTDALPVGYPAVTAWKEPASCFLEPSAPLRRIRRVPGASKLSAPYD